MAVFCPGTIRVFFCDFIPHTFRWPRQLTITIVRF
jgi:hypothetical protein